MKEIIRQSIKYIFLLLGGQGLIVGVRFADFSTPISFSLTVLIFLISLFSIYVSFLIWRNKINFEKILENNAGFFWGFLWFEFFILISFIGIKTPQPFALIDFLNVRRIYEAIAPLVETISLLLVEFLVVFYVFCRLSPDFHQEVFNKNLRKFKLTLFTIAFIALFFILGRNIWSVELRDLYRAIRQIANYVILSSLLVAFLQALSITDKEAILSFRKNVIEGLSNLIRSKWVRVLALTIFLVVIFLVFVKTTKIGITYDSSFWNAAGIPLLFELVIFIAAGFLLVFLFQSNTQKEPSRMIKILLPVLIWVSAVILWNAVELPNTYFAPKPEYPNAEIYPFSDAQYFDIGAQYILLGHGVNNQVPTDRPMYMLLIAGYHLIAGQNYNRVIFVQICVLALLPVLLLYLGKKMESWLFGVALALVSIVVGIVSIQTASTISISNQKVLMSEWPTSLLLLLFTVLLFNLWDKRNQLKTKIYAVAAGGIITLAIMVRGNTLVVLMGVFVFSFIVFGSRKDWKYLLKSNLFMWTAVILVLLPYSIRTYQISGTPFFLEKIMNVINRSYSSKSFNLSDKTEPPYMQRKWVKNQGYNDLEKSSFVFQVGNHFAHNIIMSFMTYPTLPGVVPIDKLIEQPYWDSELAWQKQLAWYQWGMVGGNLVLLAVGISAAFSKHKWNGLLPLIIFLSYHASNGVSQTSGGRYLVPVDWALYLYYLLGIYTIIRFIVQGIVPNEQKEFPASLKSSNDIYWVILLIFFGFVGALPVVVDLIPDNIYKYSRVDIETSMSASSLDQNLTVFQSIADVDQLMSNGGSAISGLGLYPRFYYAGESDARSAYVPDMPNEYDRVYFLLLADTKIYQINLLQDQQSFRDFPNGDQLIVVGCDYIDYFDAFMVVDIDTGKVVSLRSSSAELSCMP